MKNTFEYQNTGRFFAQVAGEMEDLGAAELKEFGVKEIQKAYRGIWFRTDLAHIYRINLWSRLLNRILAPLITFDCHSTKYLYTVARKIEWNKLLKPENSLAIFATVANSKITHSQYAAQVLKDAVVDYFRETAGTRPDIDRENPDLWLNLYIEANKARINLDTSGGSLHRRGYRLETVAAPMQETLAAAVIRISGWKGQVPLLDPMAGSGTLLAEALLDYCRIPAAYKKETFGFEFLPDFNRDIWTGIRQEAARLKRDLPENLISGSDADFRAVRAARANLDSLPGGNRIKLEKMDFRLHPGIKNAIIVTNPPYGIRLEDEATAALLYKDLGDFLKRKCQGSTAYIFCGNRNLIGSLGLKPSMKIPLKNGDLDGRLLKLELY